ncbi:MAG: cyclic pyranopterin monophosphate synthase MoaC [Clostridia bacterium]|nr:cyclic pyranopterin monophosphate synthase MoaC [Clostridia bacterium]
MNNSFTHFDQAGNAIMVDISEKREHDRIAVAEGSIIVNETIMNAIKNHTAKKGDVLGTARIAGIMAVKHTPDLIPLCHTISITNSSIDFQIDEENQKVKAVCTVKTCDRTGVEMEALTGVTTSLLTIYDMCKAIDKRMEITDIRLVYKDGGVSGEFIR